MSNRINFNTHREAQQMENIHFLMDTCGLSREAVAKRLGVSKSQIEKMLEREQHRAGTTCDPAAESPDRFTAGGEPVSEVWGSGEAGGVAPPQEQERP